MYISRGGNDYVFKFIFKSNIHIYVNDLGYNEDYLDILMERETVGLVEGMDAYRPEQWFIGENDEGFLIVQEKVSRIDDYDDRVNAFVNKLCKRAKGAEGHLDFHCGNFGVDKRGRIVCIDGL